MNENVWIPIKSSLKFVAKGLIDNILALVQIMAWRRPGDKPLSEPMMFSLPTHICVTRPQWVNMLPFCMVDFQHRKTVCSLMVLSNMNSPSRILLLPICRKSWNIWASQWEKPCYDPFRLFAAIKMLKQYTVMGCSWYLSIESINNNHILTKSKMFMTSIYLWPNQLRSNVIGSNHQHDYLSTICPYMCVCEIVKIDISSWHKLYVQFSAIAIYIVWGLNVS